MEASNKDCRRYLMPPREGLNRILIVTDAWHPQVNGVVRTIMNTQAELERMGWEVVLYA